MAAPGGRGNGAGYAARSFLTEEEKANAPKVTKELLLRILSYLKPYWLQFLFVFIAILVSSVVGLLPSIITGRIVDTALVGNDLALLIRLLFTALAAMLASQLVGVLENYINSWISMRIIYDMKNEMYDHLQRMPHAFFTTEKQGDIVTRMNTDISGVSSVISGTLTQIVSNVATVVTTLVALFSMSPKLAVVGLLVLPLLIFPTRSAGKVRLKLVQESQAKNDEMNQLINETLSVSGSLLMKMFTAEEREYRRFVGVNEEVTDLSLKEQRSGSWFRVVMGMFTQLGPLLIYFAGGFLIIRQLDPTLSVGTVTATVTLVNRLYRPVESLLNLQVSFTRSLAMFTRIFDYLDRKSTIVNPENGAKPDCEMAEIRYEHVAFGYEQGSDLVLTDVNFTVPGGKMYAIVGPSGSGKSTVVNLIPRLYDVNAGSVSVAGVDVRDFDLTYLRECVGMVTQEAYLFNGTILDNLLYAKPDATMEEIEEACRVASIHDFIVNQPDGYQTEVGNRGLKLSGGEKQRLSLARVVLKDPKILILDEATSALDSISESAIQDALEQLMVGRTSIVIAHRLSTILKADKIMVVKGGVIAEMGTHEELLAADGVYRELYETQFRQVIDHERSEGRHDLDIEALSTELQARELEGGNLTDVLMLMRSNRQYYRRLNERPNKAQLTNMISTLPEGAENAHLVGFYDDEYGLVAVMDLVCGTPDDTRALIRWFMVAADKQRQGVGSALFADVRAALAAQGYQHLELEIPEAAEEALAFWNAQGFSPTGKRDDSGHYPVITLARDI
ncbi:MAG: GNAT family N-acetyltransferase [Coriobacteriales bacterium]|nr:GNAT family N-acetyltransferase [Coriobacteriales bacterium]